MEVYSETLPRSGFVQQVIPLDFAISRETSEFNVIQSK